MTYPDSGFTERPYPEPLEGGWPEGYRLVLREERLEVPDPLLGFARLVDGVLGWDLHRGSGLRVAAATPRAAAGVEMASGVGAGPLRWQAPCRVLWSTEPALHSDGGGAAGGTGGGRGGWPVHGQRAGFGYGTLDGHPVAGEEGFYVELSADGQLFFRVAAYSRPANWFMAAGSPISRWTQELITRRYFRTARRLALGTG